MAKWTKNKVTPEEINNGNEYSVNDNLSVESVNAIINNSFKAQEDSERALELATGANKANGTVVEINGEPQGTWDATFAEELRNESANLFKAELLNGVKGIVVKDNGKTIEMPIANSGVGDTNTTYKLKELCPDMEVGGTYYLRFTRNYNDNNDYIYLSGNKSFWFNSTKRTITQTDLDSIVSIYSNRYNSGFTEQIIMTDFVIVEGSTSKSLPSEWKPYNPNRHITNSEAKFLKEVYDNVKNYFDNNVERGTFEIETGNMIWGEHRIRNINPFKISADSYVIDFDGLDKIVMYVYDLSGNFLPNESYVVWQTKPFNFTLTNDRLVAFGFAYNDDRTISSISELTNVYLSVKGEFCYKFDKEQLFLKSEWDKSSNILFIPDLEETTKNGITYSIKKGVITVSGTCTAATTIVDITGIETADRGGIRLFYNRDKFPNGVLFNTWEGEWSNSLYINSAINQNGVIYSTPRNHAIVEIKQGFSDTDFKLMPMITNIPSIPTNFYPYDRGETIHKEDIKPVLLWKNATPNGEFPPITGIDIGEYGKYVEYDLYLKTGVSALPVKYTFKRRNDGIGYTYVSSANYNATKSLIREISFSNHILSFGNAYNNGVIENTSMIPLELYGRNY